MIIYNQKDVVDALLNPKLYPAKWNVKEVTVRQSHIAILFMAGNYVFKLKRAVLMPDIDFSTPAKRRLACVQEMKRSTVYAPNLILGVRSVRKLPNGRICIGGKAGEEIDTLLVMKRIPESDILGNVLPSDSFGRFEVMDLAEQLAELHSKAKPFRTKWGVPVVQKIILETERVLSCFCPSLFEREKLDSLMQGMLKNVGENSRLLAMRSKSGHVKKCHGDLLLSNIAKEGGKYLFFSPVEYDEHAECIDTLYDLSYLLMDFEMRGMRKLSNILFNHYLAYMNDVEGYPLLHLYQSMRAAERAAVCAKRSVMLQGQEKKDAVEKAQIYFKMACHFMTSYPPVLIACGGLSGSGKSRVAREIGGYLNPAPGAVILRDDIVKKQINGCPIDQHFDKAFDTPIVEKVVYDVLRQEAKIALSSGCAVIVDALFYDENERRMIEELAQDLGVTFVSLWMDAPFEVRLGRVESRKRNPSDVRTQEDLEKQLTLETGIVTWPKIITNKSREETLQDALEILNKVCPMPILKTE